MKKLTAVLVGAGGRGSTYAWEMCKLKEKFNIVAVAEPIENRRNRIKKNFNIPDEYCFDDYKPLFALGKIADIAIIATMDRMHLEPSIMAIELKYDLLLEKPIAPTPEECTAIYKAAVENDVKIVICTVLRYTALFNTIKNIIDDGTLGRIMSVNHEECVGNIHQSHSFVRGNWGNSERSSVMLLQKSCHDMDLLAWLLGKKCKKVQSFGTLSYFTKENAPEGAPEYCYQGCPHAETCFYNAEKIYVEPATGWYKNHCSEQADPTREDREKAIRTTQFGKCVYKCDNDVVDHQTVNLLFEDDITVTFTMNAFNKGGRYIHIMGTKGELRAALEGDTPITIYDFATEKTTEIASSGTDGIGGGHGGGDEGIIRTLYEYLNGTYTGKSVPEIDESYRNHLIVFAAEKSRLENTVVDLDEYIASLN